MVVGDSQQETVDPGFVLLGARQQGVPNDLMLHAAVFNKELTVTSLMGRSSIVIDWIKTPGTNQTETWKQITFTAFDSLMEYTYFHSFNYELTIVRIPSKTNNLTGL
ncbi:unnamed protein product [Schistosoma mattheei]|uniref:Uncharacterized protein n=1 Tax=Schistosoma mattheei TaxID=31246 RepID=A0A183P885_9TREM|nr:unnamed protein product [Schistosoma mattheei]